MIKIELASTYKTKVMALQQAINHHESFRCERTKRKYATALESCLTCVAYDEGMRILKSQKKRNEKGDKEND